MPELQFAGSAIPLSGDDIAAAAASLGVEPAVIAAVAEVESAGGGFLPDKRPKILYEAHVFGRLTGHRYDVTHPDISAPAWDRSLYGTPGAHQYDRLHKAIGLDRPAALQSASWGRFQILGQNYSVVGFPDVEHFVVAMCESEAEHLKAFIAYCQRNNLIRHLATHDWRAFTAGYNGKGQVDHYSGLLETAYRRHAAASSGSSPPIGTAPFDRIKRIQSELGVEADGAFGRRSRAALNALLQAAGQPGL
jgi:hypothetical protein